jgi:hypothetical protein
MIIDRHVIALISIIGGSLDALGALYLAYDLLGGEHGPLRTLTRSVTYGLLFGIGYGIAGGPVFGVISGIAHGVTLGWEFSRASRGLPRLGVAGEALMSAIRGVGFGLGAGYALGAPFGISFGVLSTVGQTIAYQLGIRPAVDYKQSARPRITRFQLLSSLNRAVGYTAAGYISSLIAQDREHALAIGLGFGLAIGIVTGVSIPFVPWVEWTADRIPEKRMGAFGLLLILIGFLMQTVQYWVTVLDVNVR